MFKNICWMCVAVMLVFAMTMVGCTNADSENDLNDDPGNDSEVDLPNDDENGSEENNDESEENDVNDEENFDLIGFPEDVSKEIQEWVEANRIEEGTYRFEESNLYLITAGEKPTGGFSLEIVDEALENGTLTVIYKLNRPGPDDMVTQALTYPTVLFEVQEHVDYEEVQTILIAE